MSDYCACDWSEGGMFEFVTMTCSRCGKPHPIAEMFVEELNRLRKENERLRSDLIAGSPPYYRRWQESQKEIETLKDRIAMLENTLETVMK